MSMISAIPAGIGSLASLFNIFQTQKQYDEAKAANEQRYGQGLDLMDQYDLANNAFFNGAPASSKYSNQLIKELDLKMRDQNKGMGANTFEALKAGTLSDSEIERYLADVGANPDEYINLNPTEATKGLIAENQAGYRENRGALERMFKGLSNQVGNNYRDARKDTVSRYNELGSDILGKYDALGLESDARYNAERVNTAKQFDALSSDITGRYTGERNKSTDWFNQLFDERDAAYQKRTSDVMGLLEGMGESERADINQSWKNAESDQTNDMVSRGLTGSTLLPTMKAGITRDKNKDLATLNETVRTQKAGALQGLTGDQLAAGDRVRSDQSAADRFWGSTMQGALDTTGTNKIAADTAWAGNQTKDYLNLADTGIRAYGDILGTGAGALNNLNQNQINANQLISGNQIDALAGLDNAKLDAFTNLNLAGNTMSTANQNRRLGWIQAREDPYPNMQQAIDSFSQSMMGLSSALTPPAPQPKSSNSWLGGLFGAAGTTAGAYMMSPYELF